MKDLTAFRLASFQSFNEEGAIVEYPSRFNIFAGPNNVGKSKLVRAFERLITGSKGQLLDSNKSGFSFYIREESKGKILNSFKSYNNFRYMHNDDKIISYFSESQPEYKMTNDANSAQFFGLVNSNPLPEPLTEANLEALKHGVFSRLKFPSYPIPKGHYFYIGAERNILPEAPNSRLNHIEPSGTNTTGLIRKFLLDHNTETDLVRKFMLMDLNEILHPNYKFTDIRTMELGDNKWEIFLTTDKYGDIPLSQSGSGLKTVLQLLANTQLVVNSRDKPIESGLFLFEELENALHPRMQRNVYKYISEKFTSESVCVFSTHSPVAIDFFQSFKDASIYEVYQKDEVTKCRKIEAFNDTLGVLDALGVKASDALQSNFVVWVEGPTDRIYLKKFIELFGGEDLVEGQDFVIMFYGGRLLSHLTISEEQASNEFIRLLKINPKCAVVIDSDRKVKHGATNATKRRLVAEGKASSLMCWVTQGREIENYISSGFWADKFNVDGEMVAEYSKVYDYLKGQQKKIGAKKIATKMELATFVEGQIGKEDICLDLERKTKELIKEIKRANS